MKTAVVVSAPVLCGWIFFHPEFRPDPLVIDPIILTELERTGFRQTQGVRAAKYETTNSVGGLTEKGVSEQKLVPIDGLLTEKRTRRRSTGLAEETSGLYVGPLAVVRFSRAKAPIFGDLLPFQFWYSSRMSKFVVEENVQFPTRVGGKIRAVVTYEDRYPDGELAVIERRRLQCDVAGMVDAATIHAGLSGMAARVECREALEPDGRQLGAISPPIFAQDDFSYTHWYVLDLGWSIPTEGQFTIRVGGTSEIRKWNSKIISFDSGS